VIVAVLIERELKMLLRTKMFTLLIVAQPVIIIFLFVVSMSNVVGSVMYHGSNVSYMEFMVPSVVILTIMFTTMMVSQSVFNEKFSNMLLILLSTRMTVRDYIIGKLVTNAAISLVQGGLMLLVYLVLMGKVGIGSIVYSIPVIVIASLVLAGLYLSLLGYLRTISAFSSVVNILTLVMMYSAPLFYPLEAIPFPLSLLSYVNPLTYLVEATRQVYLLGRVDTYLGVSILLCMSFVFLSILTMRRMLREV